jgi:hypothetical protein
MTLYCGIDLHANNCVVAVLDESDETIYEKRLPNDLSTIITVLQPYQAALSGCVVESTYNWYWLVDGLMDAGFQVHLAHTGAMPLTFQMPDSWRICCDWAFCRRGIFIQRQSVQCAICCVGAYCWSGRKSCII